ncbi:glycosyl transferase family 1 [Anaerocolumna cellulosilytica]|uniref:Glycosyl transferase family 1 n=1 Tax=Anaerocolumna cellulosilytica TaxID=433286 RepID=A0A6S6QTP1_9FIRM|nr:glycosyltransferase [Anaerocolumna cellulosilytica]MBB5196732.1 UDP:flavonoid glycosyltransferase YjiC (YdhE family) [Anaerocolumna cellulosilytica]BCJ93994.1 glycosyl transferase family 1 [Anaerocolumna cellulosilytica]
MGKIAIAVIGTHGEVRPLLALAIELKKAGHEVIVCAPPNEKAWITSYGMEFCSTGCNINGLIGNLNGYMGHPVRLLKAVKQTLHSIIDGQFELKDRIKDADLIVGSGEPFAVPSIAEKYGIPFVFLNLVTQFMPSSKYPPTVIPWQNLPRWLNRILWRLVNSLINLSLVKILNEQREKLLLKPVKDIYEHILGSFKTCIIAVNEILDKVPKYNFNYIQTGLWHVPEVVEEEIEPGLIEFLESGPPPVYIGFGSMSDPNPQETSKIIEETINILGCRAIISKGWADLCKNIDVNNTYMIGYIPHYKLFPKVAAVVHHGGAGTVYTAAWAGVPQVLIPHMLDHYYQGALLHKKKLIPRAISRSKLSGKKLASAIREALSNEEIITNSARIGEELRRIDKEGINKAVETLEQVLSGHGSLS